MGDAQADKRAAIANGFGQLDKNGNNDKIGSSEDKPQVDCGQLEKKRNEELEEKKNNNKTVINNDKENNRAEEVAVPNDSAAAANEHATPTETVEQAHLDVECERLLRNAKKQVKQMMEEAVTRKFIHEDSSSIISLCVAVDACLSHGLKRRALGLFKTNSSTALVQKIAKSCPDAQAVVAMVEAEERRQQEELKLARKQSAQQAAQEQQQQQSSQIASINGSQVAPQSPLASAHRLRLASNFKRNMWIKWALIEKRLVNIVEHLAADAAKYYEPQALMSNCLTAQLLCSLLVGPSALEFSRSKTSDCYQFEEPSADELLKRHKLSNPIACLCLSNNLNGCASFQQQQQQTSSSTATGAAALTSTASSSSSSWSSCQQRKLRAGRCQSASLAQAQRSPQALAQPLARSKTDTNNNNNNGGSCVKFERLSFKQGRRAADDSRNSTAPSSNERSEEADNLDDQLPIRAASPSGGLTRKDSRRRPLALKTNLRAGALVTECHHYCCQDISEHQQTRGYSFKSASAKSQNTLGQQQQQLHQLQPQKFTQQQQQQAGQTLTPQQQQANANNNNQRDAWPIWSPRMLHETLHQNSRSSLLYAKNNVLLETQAHGIMAGYLSLHQTSDDLILKWIPNQLINGGQRQPASESCCGVSAGISSWQQSSCLCERNDDDDQDVDDAITADQRACQARSHSLDNGKLLDAQGEQTRGVAEVRRMSSSNINTNLWDLPHYAACRGEINNGNLARAQVAVGGSCLDLVISLSVSRIVLLHCHFGTTPPPPPPPPQHQLKQHDQQLEAETTSAEQQQLQRPPDVVSSAPSSQQVDTSLQQHKSIAVAENNQHETLVLVEADGVQRAPFKFPKGNLRWFLSCLESGLRPEKYLEPAIKLDAGNTSTAFDPLQSTSEIEDPSTSSEIASEPVSRLDVLLSRLPSLRRRQTAVVDAASKSSGDTSDATATAASSQSNSRVTSPTPTPTGLENVNQQQPQRPVPLSYVYRIVSLNQSEWAALQTPPLSAFSIASSSSGSFTLLGTKSLLKQARQQQQRVEQNNQKFRWSLSRLARFSSRGGSTTSSSSIGGGGAPATSGQLSNDCCLADNQRATLDSLGSFGDSLDQQQQQTSGLMKRDSSSELIRIESKLSDLKKNSSDELSALRDQSILTLCERMRKQILARAFYGWLAHCRRMKLIRNHLVKLVKLDELAARASCEDHELQQAIRLCGSLEEGDRLTRRDWDELLVKNTLDENTRAQLHKWDSLSRKINWLVYRGGVENKELRAEVWPYLLGHYAFGDSLETRQAKDEASKLAYESAWRDWIRIERVIKRRDRDILAANMAKVARKREQLNQATDLKLEHKPQVAKFETNCVDKKDEQVDEDLDELHEDEETEDEEEEEGDEDEEDEEDDDTVASSSLDSKQLEQPNRLTNIDDKQQQDDEQATTKEALAQVKLKQLKQRRIRAQRGRKQRRRFRLESTGSVGSDASITDQFGNNIHRIDKDVQRCDRNFWYFKEAANLDKLRNIMCSYVWQHLDVGYVQGMCDLAAPFLVVFDNELMAFNCFSQLMKRMVANFPHGSAMDQHIDSLKYLMQVLDPKLFEVLQNNGDYTHFYFCYRWLLLDFKRELAYEDVYRVWETIWSARQVATEHFVVFLALAMVRYYRDIIIENNMDFTDTIKFFNEMAERHDVERIIVLAQESVTELESLIRS